MKALRLSLLLLAAVASAAAAPRPNIVVILADDLGFSDLGCYGSEIPTPHLDRLARGGIRFTQFYNTSRCCPTRASLLTGLYQHQAGVGMMVSEGRVRFDFGVDGYRGHINRNCVTIAEVVRAAGYHTYMTGKWHLGSEAPEQRPAQRGFERYYGSLAGAFSYFRPSGERGLMLDDTPQPAPDPAAYYTTDAFTDKALEFIDAAKDGAPFFLYLAFNAPHWPLHAKESDIRKFAGRYLAGWDEIRAQRFRRQVEMGLFPASLALSPRDDKVRPWADVPAAQRKEADYRMAVYAAQVHSLDENVGKLLAYLERTRRLDDTLIVFLSDNGACAEPYSELGGGAFADINNPDKAGAISYGRGWANVSSAPFRLYKNNPTEGGIAAPCIAHWPKGIAPQLAGTFVRDPAHVIDLMPTFAELAGAKYPEIFASELIHPMEGRSLAPFFSAGARPAAEYLFFEHSNNCAVRWGDWKATARYGEFQWELFNLAADRTELHNVASQHPEIVARLNKAWHDWALRVKAVPKGVKTPTAYN